MVQFNLLPNVKLEYVKTQHSKRLLTVISVVVSLASVVLLLVSYVTVNVVQQKSLGDLDTDITKYSKDLKGVKDLDEMLTVQNQLSTLTNLHDKKPVAGRLFTFISAMTPSQASLNQLAIDYTASTITMGGAAPSLDVVSTYTDTLKATTYKAADGTNAHAFSDVVLTAFGRTQAGATFTITFSFKPDIFDSTNKIELVVPQTAGADDSSVFEGGN